MIIDDIRDAGIGIDYHEDADVYELLFSQPEVCHKCGNNTSKKGYTSVRPIVDCVDGEAKNIRLKHRRYYCHNCKSYVASDDERKLFPIIGPRAKYTKSVQSFILQELITWIDLPYREWETSFGVSKSCVENWTKAVFKKLETSMPALMLCYGVYYMKFSYQGIDRRAILGIDKDGKQYICHISEDDDDGPFHHYLTWVNHKNETLHYVFVDGDAEKCNTVWSSLRLISWEKALAKTKCAMNTIDDFKKCFNALTPIDTPVRIIISLPSIEKIAYDNAKMANHKPQKYKDVILKKCANIGTTMICECFDFNPDEVLKNLHKKLASINMEILAEQVQGEELFDMEVLVEYLMDFLMGLFAEISDVANYLVPIDFDYRFREKVLEQIKIMEERGVQFEHMALKLLLSQDSMRNWLNEKNLGDYIE